MKKNTIIVIGILGILLVFGAAVALAQNSSEKTKNVENHEYTPEMMKDMPGKCPEQMMQSGACENMMKGEKGRGEMMSNKKPAGRNTNTAGENHCGDMGSGTGSMMGSSGADMKSMM